MESNDVLLLKHRPFDGNTNEQMISQIKSSSDENSADQSQTNVRSSVRHITQIEIPPYTNDYPTIPSTRSPVVNRLTSRINESLENLNSTAKKVDVERQQTLIRLNEIYLQIRTYLEQRYHQSEQQIKSSYALFDQQIYDLKLRLSEIRDELIQHFSSLDSDSYDDVAFNFEKYRYLEMLINRTLSKPMEKPRFIIELNQIERLNDCLTVRVEERSRTPLYRTLSVETSTSTNWTDDYDNVPNENVGYYHVSYHHALKTPLQNIEHWSQPLKSGNYFVPLLTAYRQNSLLIYCLDRQSFIYYNGRSSSTSNSMIKWLGTRPSAIYWFDEMNMLFVACCTHIYGCFLEEDMKESERIPIRIPVEVTSTWSDTQGQVCWPKFLTCGGAVDRLLYAYWSDRGEEETNRNTLTSFIYFQIERQNYSIRSRYSIDGRLRAINSTLLTQRLGLLIEYPSNQCCHLEVRTLRDFCLLSKFELRTIFEHFHYGCCLTNIQLDTSSYLLCDHKQQQLWFVNGDTAEMKVKHMKESVYSLTSLIDGTLALLIGTPMRFDFYYDPNECGILLKHLFHEDEETFEV